MSGENPVVHFEMPYEDQARLTDFYQQAFGWTMQSTGPQMGDYVTAQTAQTDENRMVTSPGTINGGFYPRSPDGPQHPSVVIAVADIGKAMRNVTEAGGTVLGEPVEIPGIGHYVSFSDQGRVLARLARDPNPVPATIQIGITLAGFLASAAGRATIAKGPADPSDCGGTEDPYRDSRVVVVARPHTTRAWSGIDWLEQADAVAFG